MNGKGQLVRLIDVFALGPFMVLMGARARGPAGDWLAMSGIATIVFNGVNFLRVHHGLAR